MQIRKVNWLSEGDILYVTTKVSQLFFTFHFIFHKFSAASKNTSTRVFLLSPDIVEKMQTGFYKKHCIYVMLTEKIIEWVSDGC